MKRTTARHRLQSSSPAMEFADGYPLGNGRIGVMVMGGPARLVFVINHFDLYWRPEARPRLRRGFWARVRRLFREGQWEELHRITATAFADWGRKELGSFQPAGILEIWPELPTGATRYQRWLDLASGEVGMDCRIGRHRLSLRVQTLGDRPAVAIHLTTTLPQGITARMRLYRPGDDRFPEPVVWAAPDRLGLRHGWPVEQTSYDVQVQLRQGRMARASLSTQPHRVSLLGGHVPTVHHADEREHAQALGIVRADAQLDLRVAVDVRHGRPSQAAAVLRQAPPPQRDPAVSAALDRATLELPGGDVNDPASPANAQRRWRIGRHLFTAATFPGGWPANLQGIWNDRARPVCDSDFHLDLNTQMTLWHVPTGNLLEYHEPLFRLVERLIPGARQNARCIFNMRGLALPVTTIGRGEGLQYLDLWVGTSGWVLDHYWQHWRYTQDRAFLRDRFYPVLREVCRFYLDYLQDDGQRLVIYPSQSPENRIPQRSHSFHGLNSTYDLAIFRDVLERTDGIARLLSLRDEVADEAAAALPRLAAFALAGDGRLREMEDHEFQRGHRHFSHLYPVFPSGRIGIDDSLRTAAIQALDAVERYPSTGEAPWFARVGYGAWAGWTYTVKACTLARLGLAQRAARALEGYARAFTYPSGLARCFEREDLGFGIQSSPDIGHWIEIDSSCAAVAAIQEMLLQSHGGVLRLLPALPRAWGQGRFTGWRAQGGFVVDAQWRRGRLRHAVIRSELGGPCRLRLPTNHDWRITRGSRPVAGALARNILTLDTRPGQRLEVTSR